MPASASARRYASAAFTVAAEAGDYDAWLQTLGTIARVLQMPSARTIFASPAVADPACPKAGSTGGVLESDIRRAWPGLD